MRIVHAVSSTAFAGVERHIALLAAAQAGAGHEVVVIGGDAAAMTATLGPAGARHVSGASLAQTAAAITRFGDTDVLHAHMTAAEVAIGLAVGARPGAVVATRHFARRRGSGPLAAVTARLARSRVQAQISVSRYVAEHVDGPSTVVHPGVPTPRGDGLVGARRRTVLLAQRLEPEKATELGILAFARSALADDGWLLEVAGDGSERARLESRAAALGLTGRVRFLGHRTDVDALMSRAGILLAPCPIEGLGLSVLEAMATGLPVVASASGGHLETVGAVEGARLYPTTDADAAGRLLGQLAADPAGRAAYGLALRAAQQRDFTVAAQEAATAAVYRSLL